MSKHTRKRISNKQLLCTSIACLSVSGVLHAAGALEEVVVTAQKRAQNLQDVPVSVTAFTGNSLKQLGFTNSTDIAAQTPGLNIGTPVGEGNNPSITLRGVGLNDFNDNNESPVAVYTDDVYQGSIAGQTFQLFDLKRVEVLRGPQGTLYGRNATGGLVHFVSNKPSDQFGADANLEYGSYSEYKFDGAVTGPIGSKVQGRLAGAYHKHDGYVKNRIGPNTNLADSKALRGMLNFDLTDNLTLLLRAHWGKSDTIAPHYQHQVVNPDGIPNGNTTTDFWGYADHDSNAWKGEYVRSGFLKIKSKGTSAKFNWDLGNGYQFVSISAWERVDKAHEEDTQMSPIDAIYPDFLSNYDQFTQELRLSRETARDKWVAGAYYFGSKINGDYLLHVNYPGSVLNLLNSIPASAGGFGGGLALVGAPYNPISLYPFINYNAHWRQDTDSWAMYGQWDHNFTDTLQGTLGLRWTTERKNFTYVNRPGAGGGILTDFLMNPAVGVINPANPIIFDYSKGGADVINGNKNKIDNSNWSWKVALNWHYTPDIMLFTDVARGFKSGGFNSGFMDTDMQAARDAYGVHVQYKPEELTSYEVGVKSSWFQQRLRFNATAFYYDYKNQQALTFFGTSQFIVNSDATVYGGELELVAQPNAHWEFSAGSSFLHTSVDQVRNLNTGQVLKNRKMVQAPPVTFNGIGRYMWNGFGGQFYTQINFNYQANQYFDVTNIKQSHQDSYWVWNGSIGWQGQHWSYSAFVKNAMNDAHLVYTFDFSGPGGFNQLFYGPPRWFGVTASYTY